MGERIQNTSGIGAQALSYRVRVSKRAKRVLLRVIPDEGLEVVVPVGFDGRILPAILERHRVWIANQLQRLASKTPSEPTGLFLPESIPLRAEGIIVEVAYQDGGGEIIQLTQCGPERIEVAGNVADRAACIRLLQKWLKLRAGQHLGRKLDEVSRQTGLKYRRIQVRSQKSRWGSCSNQGNISLNCRLMFIQPVLVRYLLIHELCHTVHLNHSSAYWNLVRRHEPDYRNLDLQLRKAMDEVPPWVSHS